MLFVARAEILLSQDDIAPVMLGDVQHKVIVKDMGANSPMIRKEIRRQAKLCNEDHFETEPVSLMTSILQFYSFSVVTSVELCL